MFSDVVSLRDFYATGLGRTVARLVGRRIAAFWPDVAGECVVGVGFAKPYLDAMAGQAGRCLALMPGQQGVLAWPPEGPRRTSLVALDALPLPDAAVDRLLLVHALEHAQPPAALMAEAWRVLAGQGRLLVVVPNRRGPWARFETTPFGSGHPYSEGQLNRLLEGHAFQVLRQSQSLFFPPFDRPLCWRSAPLLERAGLHLPAGWGGGVALVEARKQLFAPTGHARGAPARRMVPVPVRAGQTAPAPG